MKNSYTNSLAHTTWECKYHIVFAPKKNHNISIIITHEDHVEKALGGKVIDFEESFI